VAKKRCAQLWGYRGEGEKKCKRGLETYEERSIVRQGRAKKGKNGRGKSIMEKKISERGWSPRDREERDKKRGNG